MESSDPLQIKSIDLTGPPLRKIVLINCKLLSTLEGLDTLDAVVEIRVSQTKLDLEAWLDRDWPRSLQVLALYAGNRKWNAAARAYLDKRGFREHVGRN